MLTRRAALAAISGGAGLACLAEGNSGIVEVPARLSRNNQILVPVKVNDSAEMWCLLDTGGANLVYLRPAKAAELGIAPLSALALSSGALDSSLHANGRALVTLDVGAVHRTNQELYIKEFATRDDGVIGAAVFADSIIELDFVAPALRLHTPASFRHQDHGAAIPFDIWSFNPHIFASLTVDDRDPVKAHLTVDSGACCKADVFLTPRFNDEMRGVGRRIPWVPDKQGFSTCRIRRLTVGAFAIENPLAVLMPVQGFGGDANAPDGMLAMNFLQRYRVYLDYTRKQILLEPNPPRTKEGVNP